MNTTLPAKSEDRKEIPLYSGYYAYFPAAIMGAAKVSMIGKVQHKLPKLGHNRSKSTDHSDCVLRHIMDLGDLIAAYERGEVPLKVMDEEDISAAHALAQRILMEASYLVWRASAWSQMLHERFGGAPMAPAAFLPAPEMPVPPPPPVDTDIPAFLRPQPQGEFQR